MTFCATELQTAANVEIADELQAMSLGTARIGARIVSSANLIALSKCWNFLAVGLPNYNYNQVLYIRLMQAVDP